MGHPRYEKHTGSQYADDTCTFSAYLRHIGIASPGTSKMFLLTELTQPIVNYRAHSIILVCIPMSSNSVPVSERQIYFPSEDSCIHPICSK